MISKHVSDKEGVYSTTATRRGLDNNPSQFELANMKELDGMLSTPYELVKGDTLFPAAWGPTGDQVKGTLTLVLRTLIK